MTLRGFPPHPSNSPAIRSPAPNIRAAAKAVMVSAAAAAAAASTRRGALCHGFLFMPLARFMVSSLIRADERGVSPDSSTLPSS